MLLGALWDSSIPQIFVKISSFVILPQQFFWECFLMRIYGGAG
jgi:hypothetical protein